MKAKLLLTVLLIFLVAAIKIQAQAGSDTAKNKTEKKYQAKAPATQPFDAKAFKKSKKTTLRWLGMAGFFINSRGTTLMVDPLLGGFDMSVMIDFPIAAKDVPHLMLSYLIFQIVNGISL